MTYLKSNSIQHNNNITISRANMPSRKFIFVWKKRSFRFSRGAKVPPEF